MNRVFLFDKPKNITSHDVVARVRRRLKVKRVGHAGTLDPDATGLLVVCTGRATKICDYLMNSTKEYEAALEFGKTSNTYDSTGEVTLGLGGTFDIEALQKAMRGFLGEILQRPPLFSAIKMKGKKLYEYARKGEEVSIPHRKVRIYSTELVSFAYPFAKIRILCSKGTYVRSYVHDLGQALNTGALTTSIRRLASGGLRVEDAMELDAFESLDEKALVQQGISIEEALSNLPALRLRAEILRNVRNGASPERSEIQSCEWIRKPSQVREPVLLCDSSEAVIAIGEWEADREAIQMKRVLFPA